MQISKEKKQALLKKLAELKQQHRELDLSIQEKIEKVEEDQLGIKRMKKQKLRLKDAIAKIESSLIPDLHA